MLDQETKKLCLEVTSGYYDVTSGCLFGWNDVKNGSENPKTKFGGDITSFDVTSGHYDVTSGCIGLYVGSENEKTMFGGHFRSL